MRVIYDRELRKRASKGDEIMVCFDMRYSHACTGKSTTTLQFRIPVTASSELQEVYHDLLALKTNHDLELKERAWSVQIRRLRDDSVYLERENLTQEASASIAAKAREAIDSMRYYVKVTEEYIEAGVLFDEPPCKTYGWRSVNRNVCPFLCAAYKTRHCHWRLDEL